MKQDRTPFLGPFLVAMIATCGEEAPEAPFTVRDSAGIRIIENREPTWGEGEEWQIHPEPALELGTVEGGGPFELYGVADAVRLGDSSVVVINGGSGELRCFGPEGTFLWSVGNMGEGPGEFLVPVWLQRMGGDTVAAYDFRLWRVSVVDGSGNFLGSYQVPHELDGQRVAAIGLFSDGSVLLQADAGIRSQGKYRDTLNIFRFTEDRGVVASLGRFPGWEEFFWSQGNTRGLADHPFGLGSFPIAHGDRFVLGINDEFSFADYPKDGALRRVVRREHTNLPVNSR
jgi:hypothetical protein